ncbi:phage tail tape measure protein [Lactobacillus taiwanensis]|uniref:Phage tail tape measure protein n=1 Tax=Lactobacillus taiwanensis TaxID=508451 RepID=A0A256LCD5_9LACO|nr:phage tail tape measure protein [Lactobacillus taiwanensis]OYR87329.1 phage tail tape measure protein [Lactobacillus taiwanensis]OYR90950.1 phage tail tape measure protein [Lactobacillus taiwanensis]OYR91856.1 phage tail tape measure protein [Lactobacillus taiwanensis]
MADELGHISAEIALDINPFLTNQRVLETQIGRTGKLLNNMENSFKTAGSKISANNIFKTQVAQLKMLDKQMSNYQRHMSEVQKSIANGNNTVANQRSLASTATQLQNASIKYDQLRMSAARNLQEQRAASSVFGQASARIGDYGNKIEEAGQKIKGMGSTLGSAVIGAGLYNAAKAAMSFKSEIQGIGPLLSEDGRITSQVTQQLNQMSASSLRWSKQYGISTHEINNAMTELVRRGFTANQTLGSMPAILNASRASGESLGVVMQATASSIEMFGLKANTAAEQTKNTTRVTDVLTVAANKTATSFADIAAAMTYVGPTAAQAHMSIEQTAAAIGALSNKGIEASTAGTTLRQVLSKLTTDTKTNRANMRAIGVDIDEIKKKGVDLPKLIDQINNKLKDKTPTEKMALLNAAFGKLGQGVMALFEKSNKSSKSAGDELRNLQGELEKAGGTTKRIADQMNNTPQAKWERFKQTMHATLIEIGGNMLPAVTGLMKNIQNLAEAFSRLDPATQSAIVKFLALYAAIKPLSVAVAAPIEGIGKLTSGFKKLFDLGAKLKAGSLTSALKEVDSALGKVSDAKGAVTTLQSVGTAAEHSGTKFLGLAGKMENTASKSAELATAIPGTVSGFTALGTGATEATTTTATLGSALATTAIGVGAVAGALAIGYGAYKLYTGVIQPAIDKEREHEYELATWGAVVGKETSESANRFKNFSSQATQAMDKAQSNVKQNADSIKKAFEGMGNEAQKNAKKIEDSIGSTAKYLGGDAGKYLKGVGSKRAKTDNSYLDNITADQKKADAIIAAAKAQGGKMSADTRQELSNIQADITANYVATLGKTKNASVRLRQALAGTFDSSSSKAQLQKYVNDVDDALNKNYRNTQKGMSKLNSLYKSGKISYQDYAKTKELYEDADRERTDKLIDSNIKLKRAQGESWDEIKNQLKTVGRDWGVTANQIDRAIDRVKKGHQSLGKYVIDTTGKMTRSTKKASDTWNSWVLDPKTGKVRTNLSEFLAQKSKSQKGWDQLHFVIKNAKLSTNSKMAIAEAVSANHRWSSLSWKEQQALIRSKGGKEVQQLMYIEGQWNNLDPKVQTLIATAKGKEDIVKALSDINNWNLLTPEQKQLIINEFSGFDKLRLELNNIKEWNSLSTKKQDAIMNIVKRGGSLEDELKKAQVWNSLPKSMQKEIKLVDHTSNKMNDVKNHLKTIDSFTAKPKLEMNTTNAVKKITIFSSLLKNTSKKQPFVKVDAHTQEGMNKVKNLKGTIDSMTRKPKTAHVGITVSGKDKLDSAKNSQKQFNALPTLPKHNSMSVSGAGQVQDGTNKQKGFNGTPSSSKKNSMHTDGVGQVQDGTNKQKDFNGTRSSSKRNHMSASGRGEVADATSKQQAFMGLHGHTIQNTIRTVYETVKKFITGHKATGTAGAWRFKHFAYGTPNDGWEGGPVVVGDGHRQEVVYDPQVGLFKTPATDTVMDLSKGSVVWRSVEAFETAMEHAGINNYPKFAYGTASQDLVALANKLPDDMEQQIKTVNPQSSSLSSFNETQMQTNELIATLIEQNAMLVQLFKNLGMNVNIDGKQLAKAQVENNSSALNEFVKQTGMGFS